jgi:lipoate-protein ligase B
MLLFLEHDPVITLGRRARPEHLLLQAADLATRGIEVCRASRGGEVTYHGPGQLVSYPIVRLRRGVLAHVQGMAESVISVLRPLGIEGEWRRTSPGVWVGASKICAFGVQVRHGVSVHGLALNVSTDLSAFSTIVPCGLPSAAVTSVAQLRGGMGPPLPSLKELAGALARALGQSLRLDLSESIGPLESDGFELPTDPVRDMQRHGARDLAPHGGFQLQNGKPDR